MAANPTVIVAAHDSPPHVLVNVFLRGGADGLHLVPPVGDDGYHKARPTLALSTRNTLPLTGIFRLNRHLEPLYPLWEDQQLAIIHQAGTPENSRSHFEAEDYLQFAGKGGGGWLGRFLHLTRKSAAGPLTAVSIGEQISDCLHGTAAVAMRSLEEFALPEHSAPWQAELAQLYARAGGPLGRAGQDTLAAIQRIHKLTASLRASQREPRRKTPPDEFADGLELIARLIQGDLGLRAATITLGGWDSHFGAAALLASLVPRLAAGLAHFAALLGADLKRVTVVILSEFGRQVAENSSLGTDHGRGGVQWVLGGGVKGGRVHADWAGLDQALMTYPSDVPVKTDYRSILGAVCRHLEPDVDLARLFPGFQGAPLPLFG
jgi:uncharacterized protein (DUF1501 family)